MKHILTQILCAVLACILCAACLTACSAPEESGTDTAPDTAATAGVTEAATQTPEEEALERLSDLDWNGEEFGILYGDYSRDEVYGKVGAVGAESSQAQVVNDALCERNAMLEDKANLKLVLIEKDSSGVDRAIRNEASAPTGEFTLFYSQMHLLPNLALGGYCANFLDLGVEVDDPWWDEGTADFCLDNSIYFMCGDVNVNDDAVTYAIFFNKTLAVNYKVGDLYSRVKNWDWTLEFFNQAIQNVSSDSNGDGVWDENDTYGFATNLEYGNTFFIGCDLRYILNDRETELPSLYLTDRMDKAMEVLSLARSIYHDNNVTYCAPAGKESNSHGIFIANRALFFGEIAGNLTWLNANMETDFGVLPVPKYDKEQTCYRTWSHGLGSCIGVTCVYKADDAEKIGETVDLFAVLSHQTLKPAYYDVLLSNRSTRDEQSADMLDLIFSNRVYDLAMYFGDFGLWSLFRECVNNNTDTFSSGYASKVRSFDRKLSNLLGSLERAKKTK